MAEAAAGKVFELKEGARVGIVSTCYENLDPAKGPVRKLRDFGTRKVQTRTEDNQRFVKRTLFYPSPMGLIADPITGKAAASLNPTQLAHAISEWAKEIEEIKANGGRISVTNQDGKVVTGTVPTDVIPTFSEIFNKGFKLEIQGPVNAQMAKDHVISDGTAKAPKAAKSLGSVSDIG